MIYTPQHGHRDIHTKANLVRCAFACHFVSPIVIIQEVFNKKKCKVAPHTSYPYPEHLKQICY